MLLAVLALFTACSGPALAAAMPDGFPALASQCAPSVHPATLAAIVAQESGFDRLAIGVNGRPAISVDADNTAEAIERASALIAAGRSIDLGLGQINSANLDWLGLSVADAFDACKNLAAAARVLSGNYARYRPESRTDQEALDRALSAYNTGHPQKGLRNGYVASVRRHADAAPLVSVVTVPTEPPAPWDVFTQAAQARGQWDVFARSQGDAMAGGNQAASGALSVIGAPQVMSKAAIIDKRLAH